MNALKKAQTQMQSGDYEAKTGADSGALVLANGAVKIHKSTQRPVATKVPHYLLAKEDRPKPARSRQHYDPDY